jgi:DNA modification methylase
MTPTNTLPLDQIICADNCDALGTLPRACIDLVVTSPPYDDLRSYSAGKPMSELWDFYGVAWQLKRVLKPGGVIVWVVNDQTEDGDETGSSFKQALHFKRLGLRLHDTMIYHRQAANPSGNRYWQNSEFMFVFSDGAPSKVNLLKDRRNKYRKMGGDAVRQVDGTVKLGERGGIDFDEYGYRENIWYYSVGGGHLGDRICHQHPAPFPEDLARDHILSWSNEGDIVLDPFGGSGTTAKQARELGRRFIHIDVNPDYCEIARKRLAQSLLFGPPEREAV